MNNSSILPESGGPDRTLICIHAHEAAAQIESALSQVPASLFGRCDVHFMIVDDASTDAGAQTAARWLRDHNVANAEVFRNRFPQGYGGCRKLFGRYGLNAGYKFIITMSAGQPRAAGTLESLIELRQQTGADVIVGSLPASGCRKDGRRVMTYLLNKLTGLDLAEYPSGYQGCSARFLQAVPFEICANDCRYDTQILLQAHYVNAKIIELPISASANDEVCHINSLNLLREILHYRLHRMGVLCSLKYRNLDNTRYSDKTHTLYSSHQLALADVRKISPARVLDIGCGPGYVALECEKMGATVTGIDTHHPLPGMMTHFAEADLNVGCLPVDPFGFDVVLMLDVLEHLQDPEQFLLRLRNRAETPLSPEHGVRMIITTPNVAFLPVRLNLFFGRFNYAERGILDITHTRLFTRNSLKRMLQDCGYEIETISAVGAPFAAVIGGRTGHCLQFCAQALARIMPTLFAFQFLVRCSPKPAIQHILSQQELL